MARLPPLNGLRAFDAAGRHLNFRLAADELGVTQGAVAQQVRSLEAHLGLSLFDRHSKGLGFTSGGRTYHAEIADAFEKLRTASERIQPLSGKVLISVTPSFASKWLIPNLPGFSENHPDIDLEILATEKVSSFHSDGIHLAIRQGQPPFGASLNATLLFKQEIVAVASPKLIGTQSLPIDPAVLPGLPKIHDSHNLWPRYLESLRLKDAGGHGLQLSQTALAVDAAESGQGVALVSRFLVARELASGTLMEIAAPPALSTQDFYLLTPKTAKPAPSLEVVVSWLIDCSTAASRPMI